LVLKCRIQTKVTGSEIGWIRLNLIPVLGQNCLQLVRTIENVCKLVMSLILSVSTRRVQTSAKPNRVRILSPDDFANLMETPLSKDTSVIDFMKIRSVLPAM